MLFSRLLILTGILSLAILSNVRAATYYWDSNGTGTAGSGDTPTGTWGVDVFWNTDITGLAGGTTTATTISADDLVFSAGSDAVNAYTVSLNSAIQSARLVTFEDGTVTLNDGTLSLGNGGGITVTSNTVTGATISSSLTISGSQTFNVADSRTLLLDTGTFTRNAGSTLNILSTGTVTTTMTGLNSASLVNGIIGPWASYGSGASTRYATIDGSNNIVAFTGGTAAATAANVTDTGGTVNYDVAGIGALGAGANVNTLRYTGTAGTISGALTTAGIMNVGGGQLIFSGGITTATGGTVLNAANGGLKFTGGINLSGNHLTLIGPGNFNFDSTASIITGAGGITMNGSGLVTLGAGGTVPAHNYSGDTIISGGSRVMYSNNLSANSNIVLNGGQLESYWSNAFSRTLGTGGTQIRIIGGESGFALNGATGQNVSLGASITWGDVNFNPSKLLLQNAASQNGSAITFQSAINLNGANRTVVTNAGAVGTATSTLSGVISNGTGTAGLIKEGAGLLTLSNAANSYNGATTISAGTLAVGTLANGGSNSGIGSSSAAASNLLLGNGTTFRYTGGAVSTNRSFTINGTAAGHGASLEANGSGAVNFTATGSPAYGTVDQTRTLTLTGTQTGNNILAANIADNGTGAVSLNKTGAGLWVLSGTSTYTGPTTISAGTLSVSAAANLGDAASNLVFNGGTLQVTGGTITDFSDLGRTVIFNSGQTVGLDIGGTFTADQVLNQGTGGLTKSGAGVLVINSAHTYTGTTTISAGTIRLDTGGSIAGSIINNSIYLVNQNATAGTAPLTNIAGSGSIAAGPSATITINSDSGLSFNALNTTGAGFFVLSGVTTPILGGLVGTTGNLSAAFSSGYTSGVTNLTLNTAANNIAGNSFTYGGVINDGAVGMALTKVGAGTQTLTGNNTYTGETFLNGGTLAVGSGGTIGRLSGTTGLTFNGGTLQFNRSTNANIDSINNAAAITVNSSSTFGVTSSDAGGASAIETIGAVTLNAGQMNFNATNSPSSGSIMLLTSLSRSGSASANFNGLHTGAGFRWQVSGATATTAGQIIGPWYATGAANAGFASTDYAVYLASGFISTANIAGSAETTWTNAANAYTTSAGGTVTLTGTRTITALRNTGATTVLNLATGSNLETYGLLNGVGTLLTVAPGTGGVLTTQTGGGNLYINAGAGAITVSAPINNNGGIVTLVKNGSNTLTLTSLTSNFSGGVVLNAGTLSIDDVRSIGGTNNTGGSSVPITVNGNATISMPTNNLVANFGTGTVTIANGATLTVSSASRGDLRFGGAVSGSGGITATSGSFWAKYSFTSTANTFTGAITDSRSGNDGVANALFSFNSIADGAGYGNIILNGANDSGIDYGSGAIAALTLNNRQIVLANNNTIFFNNASSQAVNINTDIGFSGTGARQIRFGISGRSGAGISTFGGKLTDNVGGALTPTINGGTWVFTNSNTYTGATTISAGTLQIGSNSVGSVGAITSSAIGTGGLTLGGGALSSNSTTDRTILNAVTFTGNATLGNATNTGKLTFSANAALGAATRTVTLNSNAEFAGVISSTGAFGITKAGTGILTLSGTNTYTGVTTISAGILEASVLANGSSNSGIGASSNVAANLVFGAPTSTLRYIGSSDVTIDRGFTMSSGAGGGATIESSGTGTLSFNNTVAINYGAASQTRTLTLGGTNTGNNIFGKVIANNTSATSLVKSGAGKWVLDRTNTYTGTTSVNTGTLLVNGSIQTSSLTTVASGATIGGSGTIGALTVSSGGFINPGNSPDTLDVVGAYNQAGTYNAEVTANTVGNGTTGYDQISVTGTVNITGGSLIAAFSGSGYAANDLLFILLNDSTDAITGTYTGYADGATVATYGGFNWNISYFADSGTNSFIGGNDIALQAVLIPEPKTALLGIIGLLLILRRRR